jgi:hypothetical protein
MLIRDETMIDELKSALYGEPARPFMLCDRLDYLPLNGIPRLDRKKYRMSCKVDISPASRYKVCLDYFQP